MMRGFLHCYYKDIYGIRPVARELQNTVVWLSCGFDRPPSRDAVDRFLTDLEQVVEEVFDRLVEQAARGRRRLPSVHHESPKRGVSPVRSSNAVSVLLGGRVAVP